MKKFPIKYVIFSYYSYYYNIINKYYGYCIDYINRNLSYGCIFTVSSIQEVLAHLEV